MKTSYFSKYSGTEGVAVSRSTPPWFKGHTASNLAPPWKLLNYYRKTKDKNTYIDVYSKEVLDKLDPEKCYKEFEHNVLLCWEQSGRFCHRRLIASWLSKHLKVTIDEYKY